MTPTPPRSVCKCSHGRWHTKHTSHLCPDHKCTLTPSPHSEQAAGREKECVCDWNMTHHCGRPGNKESAIREEPPDRELEGIVEEFEKQFFDSERGFIRENMAIYDGEQYYKNATVPSIKDFIRTQFPKFAAKQVEAARQRPETKEEHGKESGNQDTVYLAGKLEGAEAFRSAAVKILESLYGDKTSDEGKEMIKTIKSLPLPTDTTKA